MPAWTGTSTPIASRLAAVAVALAAAVLISGCQPGRPGGPARLAPLPATPARPVAAGSGPAQTVGPGSLPRFLAPAGRRWRRRTAELAAVTTVVGLYYSLFNAATTAHTAKRIAALVVRRCPCYQLVRSFRAAARAHERYVGRGHLTALRPEYDSPRAAGALVSFDATAAGLVRADGSFVDHAPARRNVTEHLVLAPVRGTWRIVDITLVSAGERP
jgi:hypothetical protein